MRSLWRMENRKLSANNTSPHLTQICPQVSVNMFATNSESTSLVSHCRELPDMSKLYSRKRQTGARLEQSR